MRLTHTSITKSNGMAITMIKRPCWRQEVLSAPIKLMNRTSGRAQTNRRGLMTLAIETSCDDTCVAVLKKYTNGAAKLLYHRKVTSDNRQFGGVHPAVAVVGHTQALAPVLQDAIRTCFSGGKPDFVTVTRGPGMTANLATGLNTAKGLALAWGVPLLGVNHMQAHALTPRLVTALEGLSPGSSERAATPNSQGRRRQTGTPPPRPDSPKIDRKPEFPFLSLLVSGGHTMLVLSESVTTHRILVPNLSGLAIGDMLDKTARILVPTNLLDELPDTNYAAALESFAFPGSRGHSSDHPYEYDYTPPATRADEIASLQVKLDDTIITTLTPPLSSSRRLAYDFAGLGTQIQAAAAASATHPSEAIRRALAVASMRLAFEHLASRLLLVLAGPDTRETLARVKTLVVSGGVARNQFLRRVLRAMLDSRGYTPDKMDIVTPPPALCTDNAAMIAWTGMEMWEEGWMSDLDILALRKWPVDPREEGGILGAGGWVRRPGFDARGGLGTDEAGGEEAGGEEAGGEEAGGEESEAGGEEPELEE